MPIAVHVEILVRRGGALYRVKTTSEHSEHLSSELGEENNTNVSKRLKPATCKINATYEYTRV